MEASYHDNTEGLAIVRVLAAVLDRLVVANASLALTDPGQVTKFHALKAPAIGIQQYLERWGGRRVGSLFDLMIDWTIIEIYLKIFYNHFITC